MAVKERKVEVVAAPAVLSEGWRRVKFGDVVRDVKVTVDPETSGLERYVAGEHMGTDDLHIRRWGTIGDGYLGPAFHRKFVKGQVLYGSRRTYLRKVAVADFDGICANTTFVLEPKGEDLLLELLPFIMQTESFSTHAVKQSRGSVNPYVNFRDIAWYEFALPPKDEQRRIAEILWAADDTIMAAQDALGQIDSLSNLLLEKTLKGQNWQKVSLGDLLIDIQYGLSKRAGEKIKDSVPILRIPNVVKGGIDLSDLAWIVLPEEDKQKYAIRKGDVLIVRTNGNPDYVGRSIVIDEMPKGLVYASYLIRLRMDEDRVLPAYVNTLLGSNYLRATLRHEIRSSAGNYNLNTVGIKRQQIPLPSIEEQDNLLEQLALLKSGKAKLQSHIKQSIQLKKSLLSELLMPHPKKH